MLLQRIYINSWDKRYSVICVAIVNYTNEDFETIWFNGGKILKRGRNFILYEVIKTSTTTLVFLRVATGLVVPATE